MPPTPPMFGGGNFLVGGIAAAIGLSAYAYMNMYFIIPPGHAAVLRNPASNKLQAFILYPGPHMRLSTSEELHIFNTDRRAFNADVPVRPPASSGSSSWFGGSTKENNKKKEDSTSTAVAATPSAATVTVKVVYRPEIKDLPNLYRDYGGDSTYPDEIFPPLIDDCVQRVFGGMKAAAAVSEYAAFAQREDGGYKRAELLQCLQPTARSKYLSVEQVHVLGVSAPSAVKK